MLSGLTNIELTVAIELKYCMNFQRRKKYGKIIVIFIGTKTNTQFYSVSFDRLRIHTPLKLEEVTYVDASFMEKAAYFKTEEQLEKWEVFIEKMNSLVFKKRLLCNRFQL